MDKLVPCAIFFLLFLLPSRRVLLPNFKREFSLGVNVLHVQAYGVYYRSTFVSSCRPNPRFIAKYELHHHENTSELRSLITQNPDRIVRYSRQMDLLRLVLTNLVLESNHIHHVPIPYTVHTLLDVNAAY